MLRKLIYMHVPLTPYQRSDFLKNTKHIGSEHIGHSSYKFDIREFEEARERGIIPPETTNIGGSWSALTQVTRRGEGNVRPVLLRLEKPPI